MAASAPPIAPADRAALEELGSRSTNWCVSLYVPFETTGGPRPTDRLIVKAHVDSATRELKSLDASDSMVDQLFADLDVELLRDRPSSTTLNRGIAAFLAPAFRRTYRLGPRSPDLVTVARRFHLKPLLGEAAANGPFYVLTLTRGRVGLLRGRLGTPLTPVDVGGMPTNLDEALAYDDREATVSSHSTGRPGGDRVAPMFHGQGSRADALGADVRRFMRAVDEAVSKVVGRELVLVAGQPDICSMYESITACRTASDRLTGDPESSSTADLNTRAQRVIRGLEEDQAEADKEHFRELHGTGRASTDLDLIRSAASAGRIHCLFVADNLHHWGAADTPTRELRDTRRPGDEDLLNTIAVQAWQHRARVHISATDQMPGDQGAAAILRY